MAGTGSRIASPLLAAADGREHRHGHRRAGRRAFRFRRRLARSHAPRPAIGPTAPGASQKRTVRRMPPGPEARTTAPVPLPPAKLCLTAPPTLPLPPPAGARPRLPEPALWPAGAVVATCGCPRSPMLDGCGIASTGQGGGHRAPRRASRPAGAPAATDALRPRREVVADWLRDDVVPATAAEGEPRRGHRRCGCLCRAAARNSASSASRLSEHATRQRHRHPRTSGSPT